MTIRPIERVIINVADAEQIKKSLVSIRETIKDCKFNIEALVLLCNLLDKTEQDVNRWENEKMQK